MSKKLLLSSTHNSILGMLATLLWQRRALNQELSLDEKTDLLMFAKGANMW